MHLTNKAGGIQIPSRPNLDVSNNPTVKLNNRVGRLHAR